MVHGKVDFGYTGLAANGYGNWYIKKGKVDFSKNGIYSKGGIGYNISGGKVQGNGKTIYLTFDDGPGPYTERLLDILKEHDVKATFFVTHVFSQYENLIKREAKEGHAVAIHSYSHDYSKIYASTDAYWEDFDAMQQVILMFVPPDFMIRRT